MNYLRISTISCIPTRKFFVGGGYNVLILNNIRIMLKGCWRIAPVSFRVSGPQRIWPQSQEHPLCHTSLGSAGISVPQRHELQNQEHPLWHTSSCSAGISVPQRHVLQNQKHSLWHTSSCSAGISASQRHVLQNQEHPLWHTSPCFASISVPQHPGPQSLALSQHGFVDHTGVNSDRISAPQNPDRTRQSFKGAQMSVQKEASVPILFQSNQIIII